MLKQLYAAYTAEGSTDQEFLGTIVSRTLGDIARQHGHPFELTSLIWLGSAKGEATFTRIKEAYHTGALMLIIHRDTDQHDRIYVLEKHFSKLFTFAEKEVSEQLIIVPLIIKHEQETWLLADLPALNAILKTDFTRQSLQLPKNVEARADTKEIFDKIIYQANAGFTRNRGFNHNRVISELADTISLDALRKLKSYRHFVRDLEAALKKFGFLSR